MSHTDQKINNANNKTKICTGLKTRDAENTINIDYCVN